jgi:hypothetical protein
MSKRKTAPPAIDDEDLDAAAAPAIEPKAVAEQNAAVPAPTPAGGDEPAKPKEPRGTQPPCPICGKPCTAYKTRGVVTYYKCRGFDEGPGCGHTFSVQNHNDRKGRTAPRK